MIPDGFLDDLRALLSIPTVAAWEQDDEMRRAADWLVARFRRAGLSARCLDGPAGAPPYVFAEGPQRPDRPTLLVYGHYDVQPARLEDGWTSDPFTPTLREGRLYARGATDQKMNLLLPIAAYEAVGDAIGCNVKFYFEGEEEILSPHLTQALQMHRDLLAADVVFSSDGWQAGPDLGDLRLGLRGFCALEVTLTGPSRDLHSGTFGGAAPNPARALARLLADLVDAEGRPLVAGLEARPPTREEIELAMAGHNPTEWASRAGLSRGPEDAPVRVGLMPTIELHAIEAGGFDAGLRTIVPSRARARLSCRLLPGQEPDRILALLEDAIRKSTGKEFRLEIKALPGRSRPYRIAADHAGQLAAAAALTAVDGRAPRLTFSGGSIPMPGEIERALGLKTVIFGFGLPDENMHGPDEFCRLTDIERGYACWRQLLENFGLRSA